MYISSAINYSIGFAIDNTGEISSDTDVDQAGNHDDKKKHIM